MKIKKINKFIINLIEKQKDNMGNQNYYYLSLFL